MCVCVCLYVHVYFCVSVLIYSATSYNVYSGFFIRYLIAVLCCIIRSYSDSSTIPVCTAWRHIVVVVDVGSSNDETGSFFYNWLVLNWCQRCSSLRAGRRSPPPSMLLLFSSSSSLVGQTKTLEWNWHEPYGALLLFSFQFIHSFIHSARCEHRTKRRERDSPERKNSDWKCLRHLCSWWIRRMDGRTRERERRTHLPAVLQLS